MTDAATTVISGFKFLEAPRWHYGRIWFSDFYTHQVMSAREDGSDLRQEATVDQQPAQTQGSDSNPCTVAAPCRTFQRAHERARAWIKRRQRHEVCNAPV